MVSDVGIKERYASRLKTDNDIDDSNNLDLIMLFLLSD